MDIFGLTAGELQKELKEMGLAEYRARQIFQWVYQKAVFDFALMANISKNDRIRMKDSFTILPAVLKVLKKLDSKDGITSKLLIGLQDGATVETVLMHHDYGYSVCVSSQVGCDMHCGFCASGLQGCVRSLTRAEILAQVCLCNGLLRQSGKRVSRIVVMGSGEPMLNFDNVFGALEFLHSEEALNMSYRNMTVSTCGIIPGINRMKGLAHPINLAVSLHSVRDELRSELMPVNRAYPFVKVIRAAEDYALASGREVTYEYILIKDMNDSAEDAKLLANFLKFKHGSINLIPANPVPEKGWQRPDDRRIDRFLAELNRRHVNATVRKEMGGDINAACGQLRNRFMKENEVL